MSATNPNHINLNVWQPDPNAETGWRLDISIMGVKVEHERCQRDYTTAGDAITSARHAINELMKAAKEFHATKEGK